MERGSVYRRDCWRATRPVVDLWLGALKCLSLASLLLRIISVLVQRSISSLPDFNELGFVHPTRLFDVWMPMTAAIVLPPGTEATLVPPSHGLIRTGGLCVEVTNLRIDPSPAPAPIVRK